MISQRLRPGDLCAILPSWKPGMIQRKQIPKKFRREEWRAKAVVRVKRYNYASAYAESRAFVVDIHDDKYGCWIQAAELRRISPLEALALEA